jgi:G3E family GTPase
VAAPALPGVNEFVRQIALADRLILNKTDAADDATVTVVERRLSTINAAAPLLRASHARSVAPPLHACQGPADADGTAVVVLGSGSGSGARARVPVEFVLGLQAFGSRESALGADALPHIHTASHDHDGDLTHHHDEEEHAGGHGVTTAMVTVPGRLPADGFERWLRALLWEQVRRAAPLSRGQTRRTDLGDGGGTTAGAAAHGHHAGQRGGGGDRPATPPGATGCVAPLPRRDERAVRALTAQG